MCKCPHIQIPMRSESSWRLSHAKGIPTMLPQHVIATPPTCSAWTACYAPPLPGPPSGRNLNKPVPFTSITFFLLHWINSVEKWHVSIRCFCESGICLWTGEPCWHCWCGLLFEFGICSYFLVTALFRYHESSNGASACTPPSANYSYTH